MTIYFFTLFTGPCALLYVQLFAVLGITKSCFAKFTHDFEVLFVA